VEDDGAGQIVGAAVVEREQRHHAGGAAHEDKPVGQMQGAEQQRRDRDGPILPQGSAVQVQQAFLHDAAGQELLQNDLLRIQ